MSEETLDWLSENTLVGYTAKRGEAWHHREGNDNSYSGAIPIEDVRRRLFDWEAIEGPVRTVLKLEDVPPVTITDPTRKCLIRPDTRQVLGVHGEGRRTHQYQEWLLDVVADILDDGLQIGSAGLLRNSGVAWVSVEMPDNVETPEGVVFRPFLLAATSHDGTLSTTYNRCITAVVCDNTLTAGLAEAAEGNRYRIRHTRHSEARIGDAREALSIVHTMGEEFAAEVASLCATRVTDEQFAGFLDNLIPVPDTPGRGQTLAEDKHGVLSKLWNDDERVTPWKNTAFGVLQAVNTASHHVFNVRGERVERNMLKTLYGQHAREDRTALAKLDEVLAAA